MSNDRPPLLIVGASARAAAQSAIAAGFAPTTIDLFADRDLADICQAHRIPFENYPHHLPQIAGTLPASPWISTGALENHSDIIDQLALDRPYLGIAGHALRAVRDPFTWTLVLKNAGLDTLEVVAHTGQQPSSGTWLLKPLASAGGRSVRRWELSETDIPAAYFLQRFVEGDTFGATFIGADESAELVGVVQAFIERRGADDWTYAGGIGPVDLGKELLDHLTQIGQVLARSFHLRGLFGVDFIQDSHGKIWPIEINPRYSASMELLERISGRALLAEHARAFGVIVKPLPIPAFGRPAFLAKRILYADVPAIAPDDWPWNDIADIPLPGTAIAAGDPVLTVFASGSTRAETMAQLHTLAELWRERIAGWRR